jgi:multidrug efflux system outer membrane protein
MRPYQRPDTPAKAAWSNSANLPLSRTRADRARLVARLPRPHLDQLVGRAITGNVDLSVLAARIGVAGAQIGEARAGALPTLDAGAGASFEKSTGQKFSKQFNLAPRPTGISTSGARSRRACRRRRPSSPPPRPTGAPAT